MHIKKITLQNVRGYKNESIELSKGVNLLVGKNNSGKSSIIRSAYCLQGGHHSQLLEVRKMSKDGLVSLQLENITERDKALFYVKTPVERMKFHRSQTVFFQLYERNKRYAFYCSTSEIRKKRSGEIVFPNSKRRFEFKTFPDNEAELNFIYPFVAKRKSDYYEGQGGKEEMYRVSETFRNLASKIAKISSPANPLSDEFNRLCMDILQFKVGTIAGEGNNNFDVGVMIRDGETISLKSMGEGVANILGLIAILLTENDRLYLIEELENDIHPEALKKLLALIAEKSVNNQFIISTHSHIVLKYLGATAGAKIFYTSWTPTDETNSVYKNIPTSTVSEIENTPEGRLDVLYKLGYEFQDFELYQGYLILEESSAEQIIRDFLIPNFVPSLYGRIKTIASRGVDDLEKRFNDFNRLFVFIHTNPVYHKRAWVMADGDTAGKDCITRMRNTYRQWPEEHFGNFIAERFEQYYPTRFQKDVAQVFKIVDRRKRQEQKGALLRKVIQWSFNNRELAIKEFGTSAREVIELLRRINSEIK